MPGPPLIEIEHVWKRYLLGQNAGAKGVLRSLLGKGGGRDDRWSLRDLTLRVGRGESVGLVGNNGAGKTTTLKMLAGITRPTRGAVTTRGRVASLLNVGAGFHRDLTGRENVYLNGAILGLTRGEIARAYDAIVEFAGLGSFMDMPVKRYSSGMYARLAFAVAAHVEPEILLVDEVLSVGDAEFQDRSLRRMLRFRDSGAAVMFVSHNLAAVELMCQRAVWLERGTVRAIGPTEQVLRAYLDAVDTGEDEPGGGNRYLTVDDLTVLDERDQPAPELQRGQPFTVRVRGRAERDLAEPVFIVTVRGDHGPLFAGNMYLDGRWPAQLPAGPFTLDCAFGEAALRPGRYRVELKVKQNVRTNYYEPRVLASFVVLAEGGASPGQGGADVGHTWRWNVDATPPVSRDGLHASRYFLWRPPPAGGRGKGWTGS